MTVEIWFGQEFETSHERRALDRFLAGFAALVDSQGRPDDFYFILANHYIYGHQIDMTVLKPHAVIVVEFKEYAGPFRATEHGEWLSIPGGEVVGSAGQNPFVQARGYRFRWIEFLTARSREFLPPAKADSLDFSHVSAFIAVSPALHPATEAHLPFAPWFRLVGLDELGQAILQQTSPRLNFTEQEVRTLVTDVLKLTPKNAAAPVESASAQNTPYQYFKESAYPANHHQADVRAIKRAIETNNSLLVRGLSGSGKSSILRFLVSNPAVQAEGTTFVYIDCNLLDWNRDADAVQEEICAQLVEHLALQQVGGRTTLPDREPARQALRQLMRRVSIDGPDHLAVVFDRSELLQKRLGEPFFNFLRALRDINPRLSFVFSGRDLNPEAFGELADTLWNEPHWIGAVGDDDARMTIDRHRQRLKISLSAEEANRLLRSVGRHPALLKYACELVRGKAVDLAGDDETVLRQMLSAPAIERQCKDLWQDLDFEAQDALRSLVRAETPAASPAVDWLTRCGLLASAEGGGLAFTSPLFERYVEQLGPLPLTVQDQIVYKGSAALDLSKEEFDLFKILWDEQPQVVSADRICAAVWPEAQGGVSPQMITNLVKRLRTKLGDSRYINNVHGRGYQFVQGSAPLPRSSDVHTSTRPR